MELSSSLLRSGPSAEILGGGSLGGAAGDTLPDWPVQTANPFGCILRYGALSAALACAGCAADTRSREWDAPANERTDSIVSLSSPTPAESAQYAVERETMVSEQVAARDVRDMLVLSAMRSVPRHEFVPEELRPAAYRDAPLPVGEGQTISQPYIVGLMTEALGLEGGEKILEVGTGTGYQAAVLDEIAGQVFTVEINEDLAARAKANLERLGYGDIRVRIGDGYRGWPEEAPFDAIVVTAAPDHVPDPLLQQLAVGGRLVLPVGRKRQVLQVWTRTEDGFENRNLVPVQFVPMTGEAEGSARPKTRQRTPNSGR